MATQQTAAPVPTTRNAYIEAISQARITPYTMLFILLLIGTYILFRATRASSLGFSSEALANVGNVLAPLVLIAAFIERAVEVLLTPVRGDQTDMLRHKIEDAKQAGSDTAQLERRLAEYKLGTRRQAFFLAVAIGLLASVLGVRGLEGLLETAPARGSSLANPGSEQ